MAATINTKSSTLRELASHLNKIEEAEVTLTKDSTGNAALHFKSQPQSLPSVSNLDLVCRWAESHGNSTSLHYDGEAIVITLYGEIGNE